MKKICSLVLSLLCAVPLFSQALGQQVTWDSAGLMFDGRRVIPVMGEFHYSRFPADEWRRELRKMKDGGVNMVASYLFWNHVEEDEGIFNWSGQRSLRSFLELCKEENMPVILRIGPFCHGEARHGGYPDWILDKGVRLRSEDPGFLHYVRILYRQIFSQVQGLQWKDGGPLLACQFDNEFGGDGSYLMTLKKIANECGICLPFYTRTAWPEPRTPLPFGAMLPLAGGYADGFWDRELKETAGVHWKDFHFKPFQTGMAISTGQDGYDSSAGARKDDRYPYFSCELGGGMESSYHRRIYFYPEDAYSLAIVGVGSGSNLPGYYMYHGGTNPDAGVYLNEAQNTRNTNLNDLPVKSYDYQAPIGEFGQINPQYYLLRKLHLFLQDFGETLAPMGPVFPQGDKPQEKGIDSYLRWSYRQAGDSAFVFISNYERLENLSPKKNIRFDVCGVKFPQKAMTVPSGAICIFPVNIGGIRYATAQIIARRDGKIYLEQIAGIPTEIAVDGKVLKNVKARGKDVPVYKNIYLLDSEEAGKLFLQERDSYGEPEDVPFVKVQDAGKLRVVKKGVAGVAEAPSDDDFEDAAVYRLDVSKSDALLRIKYHGDCARLYADGKFIADNFYNGKEFLYGLWRLPEGVDHLELRVLPMQANMPVFFPREADKTLGEAVLSCEAVPMLHVVEIGPSGSDDTATLAAAMAMAEDSNGRETIVKLRPGTYDFSRSNSTLRRYYVSNTASEEECPEPDKHIAVLLKGLENVTIDGQGSTLLLDGEMTAFVIDGCRNITLKNLKIDNAHPTLTEMTVLEDGPDYLRCKVHPDSQYRIVDVGLEFYGEGWSFRKGIAQMYDPEKDITWRSWSPLSAPVGVREVQPGVVELRYDSKPEVKKGIVFQMRDGIRDEVCGLIDRSKDVRLENVDFYFLGNFGVVGQYSENISMDNCDFAPREGSGRTAAGYADFVQMSGCKGLVSITGCRFEGAHDDPINVHGTHLKIVGRIGDRRVKARFMHPQTYGFPAFYPGDTVEIVNPGSLLAADTLTVKTASMVSPREMEIGFSKPLSERVVPDEDWVLENVTWTPEVLIKGNVFSRIPTRGILITTRRHSVIEDNTFTGMQMSGILVADDARSWYESGPVHDLTIRGNTFVECGSPVIWINPENNVENGPVHRNILIENNVFKLRNQDDLPVKARSVENLVESGNKEPLHLGKPAESSSG